MAWTKARWLDPQETWDAALKSLEEQHLRDVQKINDYNLSILGQNDYESPEDVQKRTDKDKTILISRMKEKHGWNGFKGPTRGERDFSNIAADKPASVNEVMRDILSGIHRGSIGDEYIQLISTPRLKASAKDYGWDIGKDDYDESQEDPALFTTNALNRMEAVREKVRVPTVFVKDKEQREYINLYKQLMDKYPNKTELDDFLSKRNRFAQKAHNFLSIKALRNILKSTNIDRAINEIDTFAQDYDDALTQSGKKFDSLNQMREFPQQIANAGDLIERIGSGDYGENYDEFFNSPLEDLIIEGLKNLNIDMEKYDDGVLSEAISSLPEALQLRLIEEFNRIQPDWQKMLPEDVSDDPSDFQHVPVLQATINKIAEEKPEIGRWRVIANKQDMIDTGKALEHCYGDLQRYGTSHHKNYCRRLRNNQSILLTNGKVTGEIQLILRPDGRILYAEVGQVQGKGNTPEGGQPGDLTQLETIAHNLLEQTFDPPEVSDRRCKFIHRMETHDWDRQPNLIAAINRRF